MVAKPKKKPLEHLNKLKAKCDKVFSEYVRLYHSNEFGDCTCYTCGAQMNWRKIQNGHLFSRGRLGTRFNFENCRPQCVGCNIMAKGNYQEFFPRMIDEVGADKVNDLRRMSLTPIKVSRQEYMDFIEFLSGQVAQMKQSKVAQVEQIKVPEIKQIKGD